MDNVVFDNILKIYDEEVSKRVKNKKRINEFEKYKITYLENIYQVLRSGKYMPHKYNIFLIREPKYRIIMSQTIYDKIVNHYIARYVIEPKLSKYLDIRNVATRKNMGASYGIELVKKYMEEEKRQHEEFYILKLDIRKYFYSIDHEVLKSLLKDKLSDTEYHLMEVLIDSTDYEYINTIIEKIKRKAIERNPNRKEEIMALPLYNKGKGLAIGMMTNQFLAIFYLYKLHNYIIHKLGLKHMVVYMDDYIIMHHDKKYLEECLIDIKNKLYNEYKLELNTKKTSITSSREGFVFLEYRFKVVNNKTIVKLRRDTLNKIKRNVKRKDYLFKNDKISFLNMFSGINNYQNCFKYDKVRVNRIIDKYFG